MRIIQGEFFQSSSQVYPSLGTSTTLTQPPSEESISSQVVTLASPFHSVGSAKARKMCDTSGRRCLESLHRQDRLGSLLRMLLATSIWDSTRCYLTWKVKATPAGRLWFQLVARMPSTSVKDAGSSPRMWATPQVGGGAHTGVSQEAARKEMERGKQIGLAVQVQMWATPRATDFKGAGSGTKDRSIQNRLDKGQQNLSEQVQAVHRGMWPTPSANQYETKDLDKMLERRARCKESSGNGNGFGLTLANAARMWPTPTANEDAAGTASGKMQRMLGNHPEVRNTGEGTLNPTWVEALMGYPKGWTSLDDGEMDPGRKESPE